MPSRHYSGLGLGTFGTFCVETKSVEILWKNTDLHCMHENGPGWDIGPVHVSGRGLLAGTAVALRCLAIGAFALVLVGTAPVHHTLAAAHRLEGYLAAQAVEKGGEDDG